MADSPAAVLRLTVCEEYAEGLNYKDLAEKFDKTYDQIKGLIYRHATDEQKDRHNGSVKAFDKIRAKQGRRDELAELRKIVRVHARDENALERVLRAIELAAPKLEVPPYREPKRASEYASKESLVLTLSDWHGEETVDLERMDGFNEYNAHICALRAAQIVRSTISIADRMERGNGWKFTELIVPTIGDMVSGTIHELEKHADQPITETVVIIGSIFGQVLRDLASRFPKVKVVCLSGNHGRIAIKKQYKEPTRTWDYLVYQWAKAMTRDVPNLQIEIPNRYSAVLDIHGYNFWLTHGDEFRGGILGLPVYTMIRGMLRRQALESTRGRSIHYTIMGHHHHDAKIPQAQGVGFVNGSLIGGNEFGLEAFQGNPRPSQLLFGVKPSRGVTFNFPIHADKLDDDLPDYYVDPR